MLATAGPAAMPRRRLRAIHGVAVLASLAAAGSVFGLFNRFGVTGGPGQAERQLIATVDLRLGNPAVAAENGGAKARADIEAGLLKVRAFGPKSGATPAAAHRARKWKDRYGVEWVVKPEEATPYTQAFADAYNRVMQAEIERRHGHDVAQRLMRELDEASPRHDTQETS
jgi:hypothetical protein